MSPDEEVNRRVLIIDDNKSIHNDFRNILESRDALNEDLAAAKALFLNETATAERDEPFEVDSAYQGQEGLAMVRKAVGSGRPYAMAFVDMRMPPGWNGLETIAHIWREDPELQVVICTAYSDYSWDEIVEQLGRSPQLLVLKKPFDAIEVRQLVYALTEKWHLTRQAALKMNELARMVEARTSDLKHAHNELLEANEKLAVAKQVAESANKSKSEFLANVSHEIRTPMTAILGFSDVLQDTAARNAEAIETIKRNGTHLLDLINDILDLSKIEADKLDVERTACSPAQIVSEVVSLMCIRAAVKDLPVELDYDGPIPETIQSDPTRLRQILINLMSNAIKFTDAGKVHLVVRLLDADREEPKMQFEIIDSGIGMTDEQIARLFKPFSQADSSTTRKFGGTGLGLTISRRLTDMLGGEIHIASTPGKGSTFTFTVATGPLDGVRMLDNPTEAGTEAKQTDKQAAPQHTSLDCRVLLAEDGPDNQRLISLLLKKAGAEVTLADNGQVACNLVLAARDQGNSFDVILMDIQMPVMDGYEATRRLRQEGYTGPIIALTAYAMRNDRQKCLDAGCDDYATKPIDRNELLKIVAKHVKRQQPAVGSRR